MAKANSDVRKQAWKFQEAALILALRQVIRVQANVYWHHTPKSMSIEPDAVVGNNPDLPELVAFVTHASAERAGEKKFWRTVAEVIEAKRLLRSHPKLLSVLFPGNVKRALKVAYERLFDVCIDLDK